MIDKITMIIGLPGSGKSELAKNMLLENSIIIDDPKDLEKDVLNKLKGKTYAEVIITDPWMCIESARDQAEAILFYNFPEASFLSIFFENDLQACEENIKRRQRQGDTRNIGNQAKYFSKRYSIPQGMTPKKVWRPSIFKIGDRVCHKVLRIQWTGFVVGCYNENLIQVVFDGSDPDYPEYVHEEELTLVEDPSILLKDLV